MMITYICMHLYVLSDVLSTLLWTRESMVSGLQYKVSAISTDILKKTKTDEHMLKSLHSSKEIAQLQ